MDAMISDTRDEIRRIVSEPDQARFDYLVADFLASRDKQFNRIAGSLCRSNSVRRTDYLEVVKSLVAEMCWQMIVWAREDETYLDRVDSWEAILVYNVRPKVRSEIDHQRSPASGMVSAQRRYRELARTRSELTSARGERPSVKETVEETNRRLHATRKDPVRQGMVVTELDELAARGAAPFDETLDSVVHQVDFAENYILHPAEGPVLVRTVVELAAEHSELCGQVAEMWMGEAYTSGGPPPGTDTASWIAKELGLTRAQTSSHIATVRELAMDYLAGIGIEGWSASA